MLAAMSEIAAALRRMESVFRRRPQAALSDDLPAVAQWHGGLRVSAIHANGTRVPTDMPTEFGGSGDQISPGWLFRAGLSTCAATCVVLTAAAEGIELSVLEITTSSRSDARGVLGMVDAGGNPLPATPCVLHVRVRIAAAAVDPERLRSVVLTGFERSPVYAGLKCAVPIELAVDVQSGAAIIATPPGTPV